MSLLKRNHKRPTVFNTFAASNTLFVKVAVRNNLGSKFIALFADTFENFLPKNALYFSTLSESATIAEVTQEILKLQNDSNTALYNLDINKSMMKVLIKNTEATIK